LLFLSPFFRFGETFYSLKTEPTYRTLYRAPVLAWTKPLWKASFPLKIKKFVWQLLRDRHPLETEMVKRHGAGDGLCPLCDVPESGTHIFFACTAARFLWSFVHEVLHYHVVSHVLLFI
uniref:Reverse transcriptase zinc-binding domain-containing protein n=1 Tax=Triticum urartu TaxID=4572 RepID=A0A8R7TNH1_TRIUA